MSVFLVPAGDDVVVSLSDPITDLTLDLLDLTEEPSIFAEDMSMLKRRIETNLRLADLELEWIPAPTKRFMHRKDTRKFTDPFLIGLRTSPTELTKICKGFTSVNGINYRVKYMRLKDEERISLKSEHGELKLLQADRARFVSELQGLKIEKNFETFLTSIELCYVIKTTFSYVSSFKQNLIT